MNYHYTNRLCEALPFLYSDGLFLHRNAPIPRVQAAASCSPQPLQKREPTRSMLVPQEPHFPGR